MVIEDVTHIEYLVKTGKMLQTSKHDIVQAIKSLNTGKAPDIYGLSAEHLKYASDSLIDYITVIVSQILFFRLYVR